eukprot:TRINITY_DN16388_c0_g1_i1.p3 TRINITY_DN16388_c0_g1~~TRINITY_DN16388_c0_g1_i1.p3  ORF type:complete len:144 (-),score=41.63 TRINITY_DN16388_c0_g1_i1:306-737(-)
MQASKAVGLVAFHSAAWKSACSEQSQDIPQLRNQAFVVGKGMTYARRGCQSYSETSSMTAAVVVAMMLQDLQEPPNCCPVAWVILLLRKSAEDSATAEAAEATVAAEAVEVLEVLEVVSLHRAPVAVEADQEDSTHIAAALQR